MNSYLTEYHGGILNELELSIFFFFSEKNLISSEWCQGMPTAWKYFNLISHSREPRFRWECKFKTQKHETTGLWLQILRRLLCTTKRRSRNWIVFISSFYDRQFFSLIYTFTEIKTFKGSQPHSWICSSKSMFCSSTSPCLLFPLGSIYLEYSGTLVLAWPLEL